LLQGIVRDRPTALIFCDSIVTCEEFVSSCAAVFDTLINVKAEKVDVAISLTSRYILCVVLGIISYLLPRLIGFFLKRIQKL